MTDDDLELKLGRISDAGHGRLQSHSTKALRIAGRTGARALRHGYLKPGSLRRGTGTGLRAANRLEGKPTATPRLEVLSTVELSKLSAYDGPTWLDRALLGKQSAAESTRGFAAELKDALADRAEWLVREGLARRMPAGEIAIKPQLLAALHQRENRRLAATLSRELRAAYIPQETGTRIAGIYERSVSTPTGRLAIIRREDTFTLAPWRPSLEPLRGRAVTGIVTPSRVRWSLDRGRGLPGQA